MLAKVKREEAVREGSVRRSTKQISVGNMEASEGKA
jgi:hypothetical protein